MNKKNWVGEIRYGTKEIGNEGVRWRWRWQYGTSSTELGVFLEEASQYALAYKPAQLRTLISMDELMLVETQRCTNVHLQDHEREHTSWKSFHNRGPAQR